MKDRVVLVTGVSRGIGAATARLLAQEGAKVAVNHLRSADAAGNVVASIRAAGGAAVAARKSGCVVAVSSGVSRVPGPGFCAHGAAKSGLDGFAKSMALELGPLGIRVNVVAPGLTLTDATAWQPHEAKEAAAKRTPLRRNGQPEDVAAAVLALASDDAGFITGAHLPVSGGIQML